VLGFLLAVVSFSLSNTLPTRRFGLEEWGISMCAVGGSFLLFFLRGHAPWFLTFLMANMLAIAIGPFGLLAHAQLFEVAKPHRAIAVGVAIGMFGVLAVYFFDAPRQLAIFTVALAIAVPLGLISLMIFQNINRRSTPMAWISCGVAAITAGVWAMRAILSLSQSAPSVLVEATLLPIVSTIIGAIFTVALSLGFFSLTNEKHQREIVASLRRDGLTGLFNRTAFFEMASEIDRLRVPEPYAVVMVDIDHFKAVNDTFGHTGGDTTLAHAGRLIASSARISDIAGRYGGEEFCILLRNCGEAEAAHFASRLVTEAAQQKVRLRDGRKVEYTLSAGFACRSLRSAGKSDTETVDDVIARADEALYRAKRGGRNRAMGTPIAELTIGLLD
jgi:diguanylate cyclase (GGDEF)-like protein